MKAAEFEGPITEEEVQEALKTTGTNESTGIEGLPYEDLSNMFGPLMATIYNNCL